MLISDININFSFQIREEKNKVCFQDTCCVYLEIKF
jgi:hypothetical protein